MTPRRQAENASKRIAGCGLLQPIEAYDFTSAGGYTPVEVSNEGRELWNGQRLRELRENRALTQGELADAAGIGKSEISRHERNDLKSNPTVAVLARIARALDVPLAALFQPVGSAVPRPEEADAGHADRSEGSPVLAAFLARLDQEAPAEDSLRGDILKAIAALNRALRREGTPGVSAAPAPKARR